MLVEKWIERTGDERNGGGVFCGSFIMILLLIAAGIYFFFRDGRRYWWQMGRQNGWPTPYRKYVYLNPDLFYM